MKTNRATAAILSAIMAACSMCVVNVQAEGGEPELACTEYWTASYSADGVKYPYLDCQADIYRNGTVKFYFWNTFEWADDSLSSEKHQITFNSTVPQPEYVEGSEYYSVPNPEDKPISELQFDASYYPACYEAEEKNEIYTKGLYGEYVVEKDGSKAAQLYSALQQNIHKCLYKFQITASNFFTIRQYAFKSFPCSLKFLRRIFCIFCYSAEYNLRLRIYGGAVRLQGRAESGDRLHPER